MKVLVSGASGMIGSRLLPELQKDGHHVNQLVRGEAEDDNDHYRWSPYEGEIDDAAFKDVDAVIHLSGENIAGRWTEDKKNRIRDSRTITTKLLAEKTAALKKPPGIFITASGINYYGDRDETLVNEKDGPGDDFLAGVVRDWEAACDAATKKSRVVNLRFGVVLSENGGALEKMMLPFKMGVGGIVGHGGQYWSWIAIEDVVGIIKHALNTNSLTGPVNAVAPNPVTNKEFTRVLGDILNRPTIFPLPAFAARFTLGEMADALLLTSIRADAQKILKSGYQFQFTALKNALQHQLS